MPDTAPENDKTIPGKISRKRRGKIEKVVRERSKVTAGKRRTEGLRLSHGNDKRQRDIKFKKKLIEKINIHKKNTIYYIEKEVFLWQ